MKLINRLVAAALFAGVGFGGGTAIADTIDPTSYTDDLAVGESVTVRKTVVIEASGTTDATIDVHFLFDTSGSMGGVIDNAKSVAPEILNALSAFGDLASGVGVFSEGALITDAIRSGLTTTDATTIAAINAVTLNDPDNGGDYPESGDTAVHLSSENLAWRPGSNRFIIVLSDASMKGTDEATVIASLAAQDVTVMGLQFGTNCFAGEPGECSLTESIVALGGTAFPGGTTAEEIVDAIIDGITAGFAEYDAVTVSDLLGGLPEIDVATLCITADIGVCVASDAVGEYDRSVDRTFEFDVTFTRLADGASSFDTFALVDGGIVAREADRFNSDLNPVPLPAAFPLFAAGLGALGFFGWRKKRKTAA